MKDKIVKCTVVFALLILSSGLSAQGGEIKGTIIDQVSGEPLVGAEVYHLESGASVMTDFDGNFSIRGVEPGRNSLSVSYVSYEKRELKSIKVEPGNQVDLNIKLTKVKKGTTKKQSFVFRPYFGEVT